MPAKHDIWDQPSFLTSNFTGGARTSRRPIQSAYAAQQQAARHYRVMPRMAFAAAAPSAVSALAMRPHHRAPRATGSMGPLSLLAAFGGMLPARMRPASTARPFGPSPASVRGGFQAMAANARPAPRPRLPAYHDMPVLAKTMEIRRCHAPIVPRGID